MTSPSVPNGSAETPGDESAGRLEEAFAQSQAELLGTLYHQLGNLEDARDALQDAFVKCWRARDQVAEVRNLRAWIFRIVLNTGRDLRKTAWRRRRQPLADGETTLIDQSNQPEVDAQRREQLALVRGALQQLRPEEQEVFLMRQNGQQTYEEIAQAMEIPIGTVKTRMRLALSKLRGALET